MKKFIIYHDDADGFASALVARMKLGKDCEFFPTQYSDNPPPTIGKDDDVYILDFSYPAHILKEIANNAQKVIVIDHHKTAAEQLENFKADNVKIFFDMTRSGATMTWKYFFPEKSMPKILAYIEDRDLWKWELPKSKEINAAIRSYPFDFDIWGKWLEETGSIISDLYDQGAAILRDQKQYVDGKLLNEPEFIDISGYRVPVMNNTHLVSETTQALYEKYNSPFAACYFDVPGRRVFSLRSPKNGVDVGKVPDQCVSPST